MPTAPYTDTSYTQSVPGTSGAGEHNVSRPGQEPLTDFDYVGQFGADSWAFLADKHVTTRDASGTLYVESVLDTNGETEAFVNVSPSYQPKLIPSVFGDKPAIRFANADRTYLDWLSPAINGTTEVTILQVCHFKGPFTSSYNAYWVDGYGGAGYEAVGMGYLGFSGIDFCQIIRNPNSFDAMAAVTDVLLNQQRTVILRTGDGADNQLYLSGGSDYSTYTRSTGYDLCTRIRIGMFGGGVGPAWGVDLDLAEIVFVAGRPSTAALNLWLAYAEAKYGVAYTPIS